MADKKAKTDDGLTADLYRELLADPYASLSPAFIKAAKEKIAEDDMLKGIDDITEQQLETFISYKQKRKKDG